VKNATEHAERLQKLLGSLSAAPETPWPEAEDPIAVLVQSFLLWESSTDRALGAWQKIRKQMVDLNELRVSMTSEIVQIFGKSTALAVPRAERLRAVLRGIFQREHALALPAASGNGATRKDVRRYLDSLEGMVPFVAARVGLLSYDTHAIPVDSQLRALLFSKKVGEARATEDEVSTWLTRQVKSGSGRAVHAQLQAWVDSCEGKIPRIDEGQESGATVAKPSAPAAKRPVGAKPGARKAARSEAK